jgi:hypothetical protein
VNHRHARALLGDYLEGELELTERARVDAHLGQCVECAQELRELRGTVALLRGLPDPEVPPYLAQRVAAHIAAAAPSARWRESLRRWFAPAGATALTAGLAGLGVLWVQSGDPAVRIAAELAPTLTGATVARAPSAAFFRRAADEPEARPAPPQREFQRLHELDRQLDLLIANPGAYLNRMGAVSDQTLVQLAERAAWRGDADDLALQLRSIGEHPLAPSLSARFLMADLVQRVEARGR